MTETNVILFVVGLILFLSVLASALARFGPPLLLIFLVCGMLAGNDGIGQIGFSNVPVTYFIANLALAIILLDGGLRTPFKSFRVGLQPALSLATIGVLISASLAGAFIAVVLEVSWRYGLLLGAIVASTDAAAVFSQLRSTGVALNERVSATLEIESGTNDPMAIFLVTFLMTAIGNDAPFDVASIATELVQQFGIGIVGGLTLGYGLAWLVARIPLVEGLYALLIASGGVMAFTAINQLGGSGFLGIYLVGLVIGNQRNQATEHVFRVMDGLAWLAQAGMFLLLGLLVNPTQIWADAIPAFAIALFLIFVARPAAVWVSLLPFRFPLREQTFIAWVGLRGAVPIVLALFPLMAGLPEAQFLFDIAFAVVLLSLIIQGTSLGGMARLLKLEVPPEPTPDAVFALEGVRGSDYQLVACRIHNASAMSGADEQALQRMADIRVAAVARRGRLILPKPGFRFALDDLVYLIAPAPLQTELARLFQGETRDPVTQPNRFFGPFMIHAEAPARDFAALYEVELEEAEANLSVGRLVRRRLRRRPVTGDEIRLGAARLIVRELEDGVISELGLAFGPTPADAEREAEQI
ncbi:potassium/proton antiporter [uncultured Salinisphaera sp.]|uniref:potassium/proton antiporter n=1 Tax=uncultured Salinisphaera sp. TaxID=359372 RepID=UPI0032B2002E|tara:strand:+ start:4798 stop:6549 length:1752 start_codon:yes stop_codon:yes gene_type:complete